MRRLVLLLLAPLVYSTSLTSLKVSGNLRRLRGGDDEPPTQGPEPVALSRKEITAKLDQVPVFMLVGAEGGFVALQLKDSGGRAIVFFTEPDEATAVLNMTQASQTGDTKMKLACVGLGTAFKLCGGWSDDTEELKEAFGEFDGTVMIQGSHRLVSELDPKLKEMMQAEGMDEGAYRLPVFICEELQGPAMLPVFMNPRQIVDVWKRSGRPEADLPTQFVVMDLRILVRDMGEPKLPWDRVQFAASPEAVKLANELQAELRGEEEAA